MAYCSVADVRNAVSLEGSPTDPATAASLSEAQISDAIAEADGIVNAYVGTRYTIDVDPAAPAVAVSPIRWWSRTIAAYLITLTFRRNQDIPPDEPIRLRYAEVLRMLEDVQSGALDLPLTPVGNAAGTTDGVFVYNQYEGDLWTKDEFDIYDASGGWRPTRYTKLKY